MSFKTLDSRLRRGRGGTNPSQLRSLCRPGLDENSTKGHNQKLELRDDVDGPENVSFSLMHEGREREDVLPERILDSIRELLTVIEGLYY